MKKSFKVLIIPSSDDEDSFDLITNYDYAFKKAKRMGAMYEQYKFATGPELDAFLIGYSAGIGYLGNGLYYTKS